MSRICVFCAGVSGSPITREHILPQWLDEALNTGETIVNWKAWWTDSEGDKSEVAVRRMSPFHQQVKMVCATCNNGWMSVEVEVPVVDILPSLIRSEKRGLHPADMGRIALWTAKTAFTRALMDQGNNTIPAEHYRWLMEERIPPAGTSIWAIRCEPHSTAMRHFRMEGQSGDWSGHITMLCIGELVLFIVGFSEEIDESLFRQIETSLQHGAKQSAVRVCPNPTSVDWPPEVALNRSEVEDLVSLVYSGVQVNVSDPRRHKD
jgi:hypothetical protein